jgi:hypothetical protein
MRTVKEISMLDDMTAMSFETEADFNQASGIQSTQPQPVQQTPEKIIVGPLAIDAEQPVQEETETQPAEQPATQATQRESDAAYNFRLIRERQEEAERRAYQLQKELEEERRKQKMAQEQLDPLEDDDFTTGKHHKKTLEELNQLKAQLEYMQIQQNLRTRYPDFDSVVTEKNLEEYAKRKPMKWAQIADDPNVFRKQALAYEELKEMGIINGDPYRSEKAAIKNNNAKPRSAATISAPASESPLSQANAYANGDISEAKRRANFRMMSERADQETW